MDVALTSSFFFTYSDCTTKIKVVRGFNKLPKFNSFFFYVGIISVVFKEIENRDLFTDGSHPHFFDNILGIVGNSCNFQMFEEMFSTECPE